MPALHKIAISRKTKSFATFCLLFLDSMDVWHYQSNYSKDSKSTICSLVETKHLVITQEKDDGIKTVLSYGLQQNVSAELPMIKVLKQFSLQLSKAVAAAS